MTRALLVVLSLVVALPAHAASHIRGLVTSESGAPIAGATVTALYGRPRCLRFPPPAERNRKPLAGPTVATTSSSSTQVATWCGRLPLDIRRSSFPTSPTPGRRPASRSVQRWSRGSISSCRWPGRSAARSPTGAPANHSPAPWCQPGPLSDTTGGGEIPPPGGGRGGVPGGEPGQGGDPGQGGGPNHGGGNPDGSWGGGSAITDSTGSYLIDGLASGDYLVHAEAEGHIAEFYPDTQNPEEATRITVESGSTVSGIDLALGRGGCIQGRVTDQRTGQPIAGAFVTLGGGWIPTEPPPPGGWPPDGGVVYPEPSFGVSTDPDGRYSLCGLAPGEYLVFAGAQGYLGEYFDHAACPDDADLVTVAEDGDVLGIDFALGEGARIAGRVLDGAAPVSGAVVRAWPAAAGDSTVVPPWPGDPGRGDPGNPGDCSGMWGAEAVADAAGNYLLTGLSTGRYLVMAEAPDFLPTFHGGGQDPQTATPVEVSAPGTVTGIDILLERGGAIAGLVQDAETGAPLAGISVEIYLQIDGGPGPRWYLAATTDATGAYRITGVPGGEHRVLATAWDRGYELEFYRDATTPETATPVAVVPPAETSGIDFTLVRLRPADGAIGGRVAGEDGQPITGAVVTAISLTGYAGIGVADSAGFYWISSLPADEYVVLAAAAGHVGLFYQQALSWEDATPVRVDGPVLGIDFALAAAGNGRGVISGRVTDAHGLAVPQAGVYAEPEAGTAPSGFA